MKFAFPLFLVLTLLGLSPALGTDFPPPHDCAVMETNPLDPLAPARDLALKAHISFKYGDHPYDYHLRKVVEVLARFGYGDLTNPNNLDLAKAAWCHDIVEDTEFTLTDVIGVIGAKAGDIVYRVTDEPGKDRAEKKSNTYPKIRGHLEATLVKLADRIANVEESLFNGNRAKFEQYRQEQKHFHDRVFVQGIGEEMWAALDALFT